MLFTKPIGWILFSVCVLAGCVSSENGLVTPNREKVVFDSDLLGDWACVNFSGAPQPDSSIRIERLDDKISKESYVFTWLSSGQIAPIPESQKFRGTLVVIGDSRYLDFSSMDQNSGGRHGFLKVKREKTDLTLYYMNPGYFASNPTSLAHRFDEGGQGPFTISPPVITAKTPEIHRFLQGHQRDLELWPEELNLKFRRR